MVSNGNVKAAVLILIMIDPDKIKKSEAKHIVKLIEQMTRAEVVARLGEVHLREATDYYGAYLTKRDELLEYTFGTSSLPKLGRKWGLLKKKKKKGKKKRKNRQ